MTNKILVVVIVVLLLLWFDSLDDHSQNTNVVNESNSDNSASSDNSVSSDNEENKYETDYQQGNYAKDKGLNFLYSNGVDCSCDSVVKQNTVDNEGTKVRLEVPYKNGKANGYIWVFRLSDDVHIQTLLVSNGKIISETYNKAKSEEEIKDLQNKADVLEQNYLNEVQKQQMQDDFGF